jgi:GNAT superfamily N-acetyltransferase
MDVTIRRATLDDAHRLAHLLQGIGWFAAFKGGDIDDSTAQVRERLRECLADSSHSVNVAESPSGEIVGYGSVHWLPCLFMAGTEGYVSELFVSEIARGQGVGRKLLEALTTEARARGCTRLSLINLRHRESYQRQFYIKAGWQERGEAANFVLPLS